MSSKKNARLEQTARADGWTNVLTGLGVSTRDKRAAHVPIPEPLSYADALSIYRATDTGARIVDLPAEEMVRQGFDVLIPKNPEQGEVIGAALDDLDVNAKLLDLARKTRAFGGAVALVGAQDGAGRLSEPLNERAIQTIEFLTVFDPSEVSVLEFVGSVGARNYGEPAFYSIHPKVSSADPKSQGLERVHASRVLHFRGPSISRLQEQANRGFGDSVFDLVWKVIRDFDSAYANASALIEDFAQAVFKIRGLAEAIAGDRSDLVKRRLEVMDLSRSVLRAIALDADGEDFERKPTPISGLPELLDRFANRLAAATRIPVTVLMGTSPAGLNATGASDVRLFYDFIASQQQAVLRKPLERLIRLVMLSKRGPTKGVEPDNWAVQFRPLWQPSEQEQAVTRQTMAAADQVYLANGVLSADEVRKARFGGDRYSVETSIEADDGVSEEAASLAETEGVPRGIDPNGQPILLKPGEVGSGVAASAKVQDQAMNGAQVTSLIEIVRAYHANQIPRESALAIVRVAFRLSEQEAAEVIGPESFQPKQPESTTTSPPVSGPITE
jgi:phage-related protein (TIGR01555 family)